MNTMKKIVPARFTILFIFLCGATGVTQAGQVTYADDSYSPGDSLTASELNSKFNQIKSAIDDNHIKSNTGDGSADVTIAQNTNWLTSIPATLNFANLTVNAGVTLSVPAGTTIRCTGNFINSGDIIVLNGARAGNGAQGNLSYNYRSAPHPGDTLRAAGNGGHDTNIPANGDLQLWGQGGVGIPQTAAASSYNLFRIGGGGGGAGTLPGDGGGLIKIQCKGAVSNESGATIRANGADGASTSGGGGGGIIVLTSETSVTNLGHLEANGGNGGGSRTFAYGGGGAGGGIILFVSPNVSNLGTMSVTGGIAGMQMELPNLTYGSGGGGGGASGGNGGYGGSNTQGTINSPNPGEVGYILQILSNPATML